MAKLFMIDLCSGLGGASSAMRNRGWDIITVDIEPAFNPDIVADVRHLTLTYDNRPTLVWASPPCTEFSRESMPWTRTGILPDLSLLIACRRIIDELNPDYWVLENVRGAVPYIGQYTVKYGPFYLWGHFPLFEVNLSKFRKKESYNSQQQAERACIPYELSLSLALAIEQQIPLFETLT
jgi:site-specific DNA-cytosine methylase